MYHRRYRQAQLASDRGSPSPRYVLRNGYLSPHHRPSANILHPKIPGRARDWKGDLDRKGKQTGTENGWKKCSSNVFSQDVPTMPMPARNASAHAIAHELRPDNLLDRSPVLDPRDQGCQDVEGALEGDAG